MLQVPGSKGYLVHIAPLHPWWKNRNAYIAMFGVTLSPQTAASLGRMVILRSSGPCTTYTMSYRSLGPRAIWYIKHLYTHNGRTEMRIWPYLGWPCHPKLPRPKDIWSFYGNWDPVIPILWVTGPWDQGLFGTYSSFTPKMAQQKCVYCHI